MPVCLKFSLGARARNFKLILYYWGEIFTHKNTYKQCKLGGDEII